jgi:hypothetical protein
MYGPIIIIIIFLSSIIRSESFHMDQLKTIKYSLYLSFLQFDFSTNIDSCKNMYQLGR